MHILKSKTLVDQIKANITQTIHSHNIQPGLATILVGNDPASHIYVQSKIKHSKEVGFHSEAIYLDETCTNQELLDVITRLNNDPQIHGILVQFPLPKHINTSQIINHISPQKDVDCFHPINLGKLYTGQSTFAPCTPTGIITLLQSIPDFCIESKHALVIGRSNLVGKPMATLLTYHNATVTVAHSYTKNLEKHTQNADIIVVASGIPNLITADMVKANTVVIDVGISRIVDPKTGISKIVGDVDFDSLKEKVYAISPVPGGVGPMTIVSLLSNALTLALANK